MQDSMIFYYYYTFFSNTNIFHWILSLMPRYHRALDQHLAILNSACRYEGGGHRFELDKVLMHTSLSDRALIDRVTFKYWGFMLFFLDLPSEHIAICRF